MENLMMYFLVGIFVFAFIAAGVAYVQRNLQRSKNRDALIEQGWSFVDRQEKQEGILSSFQTIYTYSDEQDNIPWKLTYSIETTKTKTVTVSMDDMRRSDTRKEETPRMDWRTGAGALDGVVFLKPVFANQIAAQMLQLRRVTVDDEITHMLTFAPHNDGQLRGGLATGKGRVSINLDMLRSKHDEGEKIEYGVQKLSSSPIANYEVYQSDDVSIDAVLNADVQQAIQKWETTINAMTRNENQLYLLRPMLLIYEDGVHIKVGQELTTVDSLQALVELGTDIVQAQQ